MTINRFDHYHPLGYQQITDLSSAVGLTVPEHARKAWIQADGKDVRWRDDGTNPTASVGMVLADGADIFYEGDLTKIKFIGTDAGGKLNVSYYA